MPSVTNVSNTGNSAIDGLLSGLKWGVSSFTYSFPTLGSHYGTGYGDGENVNNFAALNTSQQAAVKTVLASYSAIANLTFTQITETATTHADLRYAQSDAPGTAWAYYPTTMAEGGDAWFNKSSGYYANPTLGNYAFATFLHEIGHSLGLEHPHEGNVMPLDRDSMEYTVMSYRSYVGASTTTGYVNENGGFAQSLMMLDIAAIQQMYGANFTTHAGATVYSWNPLTGEAYVNGVGRGAPVANRIFETVWDGGGVDTYDFSNYASGLKINLAPGEWTTTSTTQLARLKYDGSKLAAGNIANALLYNGDLRSLIENAFGGSGDDAIVGNQAANWLKGNGGADRITGGLGDDTLDGGAGSDTAVFSGARSSYTITNLADGSLQIQDLRAGADGKDVAINVESFQFSDRIYTLAELTGSTSTPDPQPPTGSDLILAGTSLANTLTGQSGNDTLDGKAGNDLLYGMEGDDTLIGGAGADLLDGGAGTDTASYATAIASVTADLLVRTANKGDATGDTYVSIENLTGSAYADVLNGDDQANVLAGGGASDTLLGRGGDDMLNGGDGNDTLTGGAGGDTLDGGAGTDTAVFGGVMTDYAFTVLADGSLEILDLRAGSPDGRDIARNVESFRFAEGAYTLAQVSAPPPPVVLADQVLNGTSAVNILLGSEGNDSLDGKGGNDQLLGGNGDDTLIGGAGADKLDGGAGRDSASYATALAGVTADLLTPSANSADAFGDRYISIENLIGSNYADRLNGDDAANVISGAGGADVLLGRGGDDRLSGGDGNDTLTGGAGDDLLEGGAGVDTAIYTGLKADYSFTILADGSLEVVDLRNGSLDGRDIAWNVESFRFTDGLFTYAQVTALPPPVIYTDQVLNGDPLANSLAGSEGNDTLDGKGGNDQLSGGNGADILIGGLGADKLDGGAGRDTASYATATASVTADLLSPTLGRGDAYGDTYVSIENLTGSNYADTLRGDDSANVISGGGGVDMLLGRGGNDSLFGGDGNDTLSGGLGQDELWGGAGNDVFQFQSLADSSVATPDVIQDFFSGIDKIDLRSIDARSNLAYDQAFTYIGGGAFTGVSGQLQFTNGLLSGDVNGDKIADFQIQIANVQTLTASDFYL